MMCALVTYIAAAGAAVFGYLLAGVIISGRENSRSRGGRERHGPGEP